MNSQISIEDIKKLRVETQAPIMEIRRALEKTKGNLTKAKEALKKSLQNQIKVSLFPVNLKKLQYYQYYNLGQCYLETGERDMAKDMFLKSLGLHSDHFKSLQSLGFLALEKGQVKEASE